MTTFCDRTADHVDLGLGLSIDFSAKTWGKRCKPPMFRLSCSVQYGSYSGSQRLRGLTFGAGSLQLRERISGEYRAAMQKTQPQHADLSFLVTADTQIRPPHFSISGSRNFQNRKHPTSQGTDWVIDHASFHDR